MLAIYKKEMHAYFTSMIGWLFLFFLLLGVGLFHWIFNILYGYSDFAYVLSSVSFIFILIIPVFTMRIIAEEGRQKTDQLLYTSPVSIVKIVLGKYLAMVSIFAIGMLILSVYPLTMMLYGDVNLKMEYGAILGFLLLGSTYMAIGMFVSAITDIQILAALMAAGIIFATIFASGIASVLPTDNLSVMLILAVLWLVVAVVTYVMMKNVFVSAVTFLAGVAALVLIYFLYPAFYDGALVTLLSTFAIADQYTNLSSGIFDLSDIVYFITVSGMFLFFTIQVINKKRWS